MRLEIKINWEKQANKQTNNNSNKKKQKQAKKKTNQKTKNSNNRKSNTLQNPTHFSEGSFTSSLPVSISKICLLSIIYLRYGMMLFIMSHFFVKAIVFIELVKAISFSIVFTFRISAMRLFKFMNFFSLDLNTYNLNMSRMWLINTLLFLKMESLLADSGISNMAACGVKVGNIKLLWKHWARSTHKHLTASHS